jgi:phosphoribosylanthranilate isomerase
MSDVFKKKKFMVKVCGLVREEDVRLCLELGVDMTGFIFVPSSPRYLPPERAARLPRGRAARVGVFSGQRVDFICDVLRMADLDYAQLHGDEDADFCREIGPERVIKVLWPQRLLLTEGGDGKAGAAAGGGAKAGGASGRSAGFSGAQEKVLAELLREECARFSGACSCFLLDAGMGGGGSGSALPWAMLQGFAPEIPWLLAGGIGPRTVQEALAACTPWGIDCNSGVEDVPGKKNPRLLRELLSGERKF